MLFTTQKNSKSFLEENKKDNNNLVSNENICGNNQRAQYIFDTSIDPDDGTYKTTYSERTEKYTRKHAHFLTNHFNDRWGKKVVGLKNIKKEQNE